MLLETECSNCSKKFKINAPFISNRLQLAKAKAEEFEYRCNHCNSNNLVYVDEVNAYINEKLVLTVDLIAVALAVVLTLLLWQAGFIAVTSISVPIVASSGIRKSERAKVRVFNDLYYNRQKMMDRYSKR